MRLNVRFPVMVFALIVLSSCSPTGGSHATATGGRGLPMFLELGSTVCIPCQQMAPIVEEIRKEYDGRLIVEFHDVNKEPKVADAFGVRAIPTQIFIDKAGKETFRHIGFFSHDEITGVLKEMGL